MAARTWLIRIVVLAGGNDMGSSRFIGGTGKFAKYTGSFRWQRTPLYGTTAVVRWSGECQ